MLPAPVRRSLRYSAAYRLTHRRRARAFGIGLNKTGTHSLAALFRPPVRAGHEADVDRLLDLVLDRAAGRLDEAAGRRALARHLERCWLDVHVSHPLGDVVDVLVALEPEGRYVLTVRPPDEYLRSVVNAAIKTPGSARWQRYKALRYQAGVDASPHDAPLLDRGLYPVAGILGRWRKATLDALDAVPPAQLLVVPTAELPAQAGAIAVHCGLDAALTDPTKAHQHATGVDYGVLDELDPTYLADQIEAAWDPRLRALFDPGPLGAQGRA